MDPAEGINYCVRCGQRLERREIFGALRPVCPACGRIHFVDPKVAVGLLIEAGRRLLLVRRSQDPQRGKWSIPAGFMDGGEDPQQAARREAREETGLEVYITGLQDIYPRGDDGGGADMLLVYKALVTGGELQPGDDASEAGYFAADSLPELAFDSTQAIIARWQQDIDKRSA
ncbi:MAG: NUDIX hydrolase [Anaerolineales bacterium]